MMNYHFLDQVVSFNPEGGGRIVTVKTFLTDGDYLEGPFHSPAEIPSSIVLESMAQSAGRLIEAVSQNRAYGIMLKVQKAQFFFPVAPGNRLLVHSEMLGMQDQKGEWLSLAETESRAVVEDRDVAQARLIFLCVPTKRQVGIANVDLRIAGSR